MVLLPGAGAGCRYWCCVRTWCCELAVHEAETGCWCQAVVLVVGAGWVLVPVL